MRKTFEIERGSFLHNSIPEVKRMSVTHFDPATPKCFFFRNQSKHLSLQHSHISILFWCALVILYDVTGLSPPFPKHNAE